MTRKRSQVQLLYGPPKPLVRGSGRSGQPLLWGGRGPRPESGTLVHTVRVMVNAAGQTCCRPGHGSQTVLTTRPVRRCGWGRSSSFAAHPVAVTVELAAVAGIAGMDRRCSGSSHRSTVRIEARAARLRGAAGARIRMSRGGGTSSSSMTLSTSCGVTRCRAVAGRFSSSCDPIAGDGRVPASTARRRRGGAGCRLCPHVGYRRHDLGLGEPGGEGVENGAVPGCRMPVTTACPWQTGRAVSASNSPVTAIGHAWRPWIGCRSASRRFPVVHREPRGASTAPPRTSRPAACTRTDRIRCLRETVRCVSIASRPLVSAAGAIRS